MWLVRRIGLILVICILAVGVALGYGIFGGDQKGDKQLIRSSEPANVVAQADPFDGADAALKRDNDEAALRILLPLAQQGNAQAQFRVGELYYLFKKQDIEALKWFQQAANKGSRGAMYYLGNMYNNGGAVRQNIVEAEKWYILSASQSGALPKGEMDALRMASDNRDALARKLTASQIATAQQMARDWSKQHGAPDPDPRRTAVAASEPQQNCSTSSQFKTCTVVELWGTRTTVTNLRATQQINTEFGNKLQNIHSVRMVFNDVQTDETSALAMIGGFMMLVLPSSTQDQRAALLKQISSTANKSSVQAYGWTWSINSSGPIPGKSITFEATQ